MYMTSDKISNTSISEERLAKHDRNSDNILNKIIENLISNSEFDKKYNITSEKF